MFTVKAYAEGRTRIYEAESLTILRYDRGAEVTLHRTFGVDNRIDVGDIHAKQTDEFHPPIFEQIIIENSNGKTSEVIRPGAMFHSLAPKAA